MAGGDSERLLRATWSPPPGLAGRLCAVNHKVIGLRFIVTAFGFLLLGGVLALIMRTQLAQPDGAVVGAETFNELFTVHGSTMMFLFAVPVVEGLAMYFMPLLLGTRDLPFPRLNAFGYWAYLFGGLLLYGSYLVGDPPDAGWFAYVPLAGPEFSPDMGMDFWLLGITFVEVAGIIGAIELIVGFFLRRAPGMSLGRVPVLAWAFLVMAVMMLVAFPALVTASVMLELERAFGAGFYVPELGGDPLLWQHLFWFFGHPEVYIMFVPAAGVVSAVVPIMCRRELVGHAWVVAALITIGLVSFGLWIHHMFTVGLPLAALGIFSASSFLIAIPSGVQFAAWLATLWRGRPQFRPQLLFVLGFVVTFLIGGITGVMVAAAPFDWVVHDTYFVVAHFHYVLIGGVLFPLAGAVYHWFPKWTGRLLGPRLGQASFWTMFAGLNLTFFPQHFLGLDGMPRRVFTYSSADGWSTLNLLSSAGAFVLATGIGLTLLNVLLSFRGRRSGADPWDAVGLGVRSGSLEWTTTSPPPQYNFARIPDLADEPHPATGALIDRLHAPPVPVREALETSPLDASPRHIIRVADPSALPLLTALAGTGFLIAALASAPAAMVLAALFGAGFIVAWGAGSLRDRATPAPSGVRLWMSPSDSGALAAVLAGVVQAVMVGSLVFAYLLFVARGDGWPPEGVDAPSAWEALAVGLPVAVALTVAVLGLRPDGPAIRIRVALTALAALAGVVLAICAGVMAAAEPGLADGAYGAIMWTLLGAVALAAAGVLVTAGVATWHAWRVDDPAEHAACARVARIAAWVLALTCIVVLLTAYVTPHLTAGPA